MKLEMYNIGRQVPTFTFLDISFDYGMYENRKAFSITIMNLCLDISFKGRNEGGIISRK